MISTVAWAAGFFDGEGSTCHKEGIRPTGTIIRVICLSISQCNLSNLEKFKQAIGGIGNICGPMKKAGSNRRPIYQYYCSRLLDVSCILHLLWSELSIEKKLQAINAIKKYRRSAIGKRQRKRKFKRSSFMGTNKQE